MAITSDTRDGRRPARGEGVRAAILDTAAALFSEHGIRAVSADRVLAEAGYSKVTFYRHFPRKDDLVVAYLERELERVRGVLKEAEGASAPAPLSAVVGALSEEMCRPHFRGCPFINAAAEYPDPTHPVRRVVADFRALMIAALTQWLAPQGVGDPRAAAHQVMMLRDGALVAGYLSGDVDTVARELSESVTAVIRGAQSAST